MDTSPDLLDVLREALIKPSAASEDQSGTLAGGRIRLLDVGGQSTVDDISQAATIEIDQRPWPKSQITRLARSRNALALQSGSTATPESDPESFFPLDAIIFALLMANAQGGLYVVQATNRGIPRFEALERNDILAYLTGKRAEWDGVLSVVEIKSRKGAAENDQAVKLPTKRAYVPSKADAAFVKRLRTSGVEIVLQNRNDAMHGAHPWTKTADFSSFRMALAPTIEAARKAAARKQSGAPVRGTTQTSSANAPARKQRAQDPIIMLSNSPTALINMFNVKKLLEEGIFVDPVAARTAANGVTEPIVAISHRNPATSNQASQNPSASARGGRFLVVDNVDSLQKLAGGQDVWQRVVVVFTTGQTWQFKNYYWSEPRELFRHVMGVYARWNNEPKNANVQDWPITELVIDRSKRHTDRQVISHFWRSVDSFVSRRKSHLVM
ncbi:CDC73-domain-containing protein [Meira miltonrushii]|uniref:CDC73-domain-containing protein n=1 Tax=Meira miltonrushii TaxID=1280837 RepID=A0A316V8X1_9BASI|nr:CDC73-domain-containing protein [Meira miltonrushii]PWN31915.1 CDC73-domain-containing protein [Meira miltonrushii]